MAKKTRAAAFLGMLLVLTTLPAAAQKFSLGESQLAGVRLSENPTVLLRAPAYGPPDAVIASGGVFNTRLPSLVEAAGGGPPAWAQAVWVDGLSPDQVVWLYNRPPVAVAFVINGQGDEAEITDIIVSFWNKVTASSWAQTKKGIRLADTFAKVMLKYGFPETLTVFQAGGSPMPQAGPGALPLAGTGSVLTGASGLRLNRRGRGRRYAEQEDQALAAAPMPAAGLRAGPLPPATPAGASVQEWNGNFSGVAMGQQLNLSRHVVMGYSQQGIDFYLYNMQVVRIHAYAVSAAAGPTGPAGAPAFGAAATVPTALPTRVSTPYTPRPLGLGRRNYRRYER